MEVREGVVRPCEDPALNVLDRYWKMSCNLDNFSWVSVPSKIDDARGGDFATVSEKPFEGVGVEGGGLFLDP